VGRRSAENGAARLSVSGPSRSASKLVYPGCAYLAPSRHRILSVECLLLALPRHSKIRDERLLSGGDLNRSTQHLLILLDKEVADGDVTDIVHGEAEG
jgi:hypothetical protein